MTTSPLFKRVPGQWPQNESPAPDALTPFRKEIREWWSFNSAQRHTHSWHTREDFIKRLPEILSECGIHPAASSEPPAEEVETLRAELLHERGWRIRLQAALMYWHPGVSEQIEIETNGRAGDDAGLLAGFEGELPERSWGESAVLEIQTLRKDAARYRWLRDGNAFAPEEEMIRGGDELDEYIDREIARAKGGG